MIVEQEITSGLRVFHDEDPEPAPAESGGPPAPASGADGAAGAMTPADMRREAQDLQHQALNERDPIAKRRLGEKALELREAALAAEKDGEAAEGNSTVPQALPEDAQTIGELSPEDAAEFRTNTTELTGGAVDGAEFQAEIAELSRVAMPLIQSIEHLEKTEGLDAADAHVAKLDKQILRDVYGDDPAKRDRVLEQVSDDIFNVFGDDAGEAIIEALNTSRVMQHPLGHARVIRYAERITGRRYA